MQGNPKLIETLNALLADELAAINQYIAHFCVYDVLIDESFEKRAIDEMKHAEQLIGRILFLGGKPIVSNLSNIHIGENVPKQVEYDRAAEESAIKAYNEAIALAAEVGDHATRDILIKILNDEDRHIDELEELLDQIEHMTLPIFLSTQVD